MRLFQYWDASEPPEDVAALVQSVREMAPALRHQLFDRGSAARFIGKQLGDRQRSAFLSLAVPAMQADYFRLCALWAKGGVWIDADSRALRPLGPFIRSVGEGFLSMWDGKLQNHVIVSRARHDPFLGAAVELSTRHIEQRLQRSAYYVTGPRVLNLIWTAIDPLGAHADGNLRRNPDAPRSAEARGVAALFPGALDAFSKFTRAHDWQTNQWIMEVEDAAYKSTTADWRSWKGSIYRNRDGGA